MPDGMTQGYVFPEEAVRRGRQVLRLTNTPAKALLVFKLNSPDGMTQGYDFPEAAVRRGRQVLGFANTPAKGNAQCA